MNPETQKKIKRSKLERYGDPNYNAYEKIRRRNLEKYGKESFFQTDEFRKKALSKMLSNGYDHPMHSEKIKWEMAERYEAAHGVRYSFQDESVKKKIVETNLKRYGVEYMSQRQIFKDEIHRKSTETQRRNFFEGVLSKGTEVSPLFSADEYVTATDKFSPFMWKCLKCGNEFESPIPWGNNVHFPICRICHPKDCGFSNFEREIYEFVSSLGDDLEVLYRNGENRKVIPGYEIDIIVKKNGKTVLGIEADGLYWHSDEFKVPGYHLMKTELCEKSGFQLVHVFDDEWRDKRTLVEGRLGDILGKFQRTVFARKCVVREVFRKEAVEFLEDNHLQGKCASKVSLGLYLGDELVSLMSFGKKRAIYGGKSRDGEFELLRFCCKVGVHVPGAASRLLKTFERMYSPKEIISYADRRWSVGNLYLKLGFSLDHVSKPGYWYMDSQCRNRFHRYGFRKNRLPSILEKFDPEKTEMDNMKENGYRVIWDCGNMVFRKSFPGTLSP